MDCGKGKMDSTVATGSLVLIALILPFFVYAFIDTNWRDLTLFSHGLLISLLSFSSAMLWTKMFLVFSRVKNSMTRSDSTPATQTLASSYPAASAIVAGNLDSEFESLMKTTEAFFDVVYPGKLQVIVTYSAENHSNHAGKELQLRSLVERMPHRFLLHCVENVSNQESLINTAAQIASGEFVSIFFAGHYPTSDCIMQAYRWREAQASTTVKSEEVKTKDSTWRLSTLETADNQDLFSTIGSKMETVYTTANEFCSYLWPRNSESISEVLRRSDLSISVKSMLVYEYIWMRVFPWAVLQILPLVGFLLFKNSDLHNLGHLDMNQIAANLMMSSY